MHVLHAHISFYLDFHPFHPYLFRLATQRDQEYKKIVEQLHRIRANVKLFQDVLQSGAEAFEQSFVERLKTQMELAESTILTFKREQREVFEQLVQSEKTLSREVAAYVAKFESWTSAQGERTARPGTRGTPSKRGSGSSHTATTKAIALSGASEAAAAQKACPTTVPAEVHAFDRYAAAQGHKGGWEEYDHRVFLGLRKKFRAAPQFIDAVVEALPGLTHADVVEHEQWYDEYVFLLEAKKAAITRWRSEKEEQRQAQLRQADDNLNDGGTSVQSSDLGRTGLDDKAAAAMAFRAQSEKELEQQERAEKKAQIAQWRAARTAAQEAAQAHEREESARVQGLAAAAEAARRTASRQQAMAVRAARAVRQQEAEEAARAQAASRPKVPAAALEALRAQDAQRLEQRRMAQHQAEAEAALRAERLERLRAKVFGDVGGFMSKSI